MINSFVINPSVFDKENISKLTNELKQIENNLKNKTDILLDLPKKEKELIKENNYSYPIKIFENKMIIPIRCFTCGNVIGSKYNKYKQKVIKKQIETQINKNDYKDSEFCSDLKVTKTNLDFLYC